MRKTVIIGAGVSGLAAAYFSKTPYILLEKNQQAGGLCRSFYEDGFTFDCSGHFIHMKDEKIKKLVGELTGGVDEIERNASIYIHNRFVPYPFQANLYYLDDKTKKSCINGVLKRKEGQVSTSMPFIDWSMAMFGSGITKYFMEPYNKKLWSYDLKKMTALWSGAFVPKPDAAEIIKSAHSKNAKSYGYNSVFYYPKRKGCQALIDGLLKKTKVYANVKTQKIDLKNKTVSTSDGQKIKYSKTISTQSLPELTAQIQNAPKEIRQAAAKLIATSVKCVNIGVSSNFGAPKILQNRHWIYLPENKFPFYRIGVYSNANKDSAPKNSYSFYVEFSSSNGVYKNCENAALDLIKAGFIRKRDKIAALNVVDMPNSYVIFDKNRQPAVDLINAFLKKNKIYSIGRYGAWEYSFIEKNIKDAADAAEI